MLFEMKKERETKLVINPSISIIFPSFNLHFFLGVSTIILIIPNNSI
jgi:hypothetical protein